MLRVIAGELRGRRLATPEGNATRPTGDRVRESLFDLLGPGQGGARVLDLFAGSGALGIEALSRGAAHAVFVERDRDALRVLRANLAALALSGRSTVVAGDAFASWPGERPRVATKGGVVRPSDGWAHDGRPAHLRAACEASLAALGAFDLLLADPPWAESLEERTLAAAAGRLAPGGVLVLEHPADRSAPEAPLGLSIWKARRYGSTSLTLYLRAAEEDS